jgi:hypothetical protein
MATSPPARSRRATDRRAAVAAAASRHVARAPSASSAAEIAIGMPGEQLPPTVAMLRTCGPPTTRATGCSASSSRWARICAMVTPAPSVTLSPETRISRSAGSVTRTSRAGARP